jgi:hypothetical protein
MICPKCNHENEDDAMFCRHCGSSMNPVPEKESNTSSILIFVWIIAVGVLSVITTLYTEFVGNWYEGISKMIYIGIQIIHNFVMILPAFAIKNKTLKIIGIILMAGLVIWWVFSNIQWALSDY